MATIYSVKCEEPDRSLYEYEVNTWDSREADRLIEGGWHNHSG